MQSGKASLDRKGEGRKLRRARNVVKKWNAKQDSYATWMALPADIAGELDNEIQMKRWERAQALLVTAALLKD